MSKGNHIDSSNSPLPQNADSVVDTSLDNLIPLTLTKKQWTIIYNVMLNSPLAGTPSVGNIRALIKSGGNLDESLFAVLQIIDTIQPIVVQLSDKDIKPAPQVET